jgi:hypothetical protein
MTNRMSMTMACRRLCAMSESDPSLAVAGATAGCRGNNLSSRIHRRGLPPCCDL